MKLIHVLEGMLVLIVMSQFPQDGSNNHKHYCAALILNQSLSGANSHVLNSRNFSKSSVWQTKTCFLDSWNLVDSSLQFFKENFGKTVYFYADIKKNLKT